MLQVMTRSLPASAGFAFRARRNGQLGHRCWLGVAAGVGILAGAACVDPLEGIRTGGLPRKGTAAWDPGLEIRFHTPGGDGMTDQHAMHGESSVRQTTANATPITGLRLLGAWTLSVWNQSHDRMIRGYRSGDFTHFALIPGRYEFEYDMAWRNQQVGGEILVREPTSDRAQDFLRYTSLVMNPGGDLRSVLSEEDLGRAMAGDVVTKVVFVANLASIDDRVAMIDREIRRIEDLEGRLASQEDYWDAKRAERRRNAFFAADQGWGEDIPSTDMALYQLLVGPERYHWERYSLADDRVRRYSEELASLDRPLELLREERSALRSILGSVSVLSRSGEMIVAMPSMTQRYRNPVDEIARPRQTLGPARWREAIGVTNPRRAIEFPYLFSWGTVSYLDPVSYTIGAPAGLKSVRTRSGMEDSYRSMGEVVAVVRIGPRMPASLD